MKSTSHDKHIRNLQWAVFISLILGFILFRPFLSVIIVALITSFLSTPIYNRLLKKTKKPGFSSMLTFVIALLVLIIPLILIIIATIMQAKVIATDLSNLTSGQEYQQIFNNLLNSVNRTLSSITGKEIVYTSNDVWDTISKYIASFASMIVQILTGWISSIGSIIANLILFIYIFTGVLVNKESLVNHLEKINPLGKNISDMYLERAGSMTKGMVGGQFTIAAIQGLISALGLYIAGLHYFAFFALILSFLSVIPLGAGIVTIPIGIVMILVGNVWQGVLVILNHLIIVTNIDNVLKPKLVPKSVRLHPALILLAVFGGMHLFGILGIVIGPVLLVLITSTLEIYLATQTKTTNKELIK